jgi:hypothetical protein
METKKRNMIRAGHHSGEAGCFCTEECIGQDVKRLQWTQKDAVKFECRMHYRARMIECGVWKLVALESACDSTP